MGQGPPVPRLRPSHPSLHVVLHIAAIAWRLLQIELIAFAFLVTALFGTVLPLFLVASRLHGFSGKGASTLLGTVTIGEEETL